jgi:tRNA (guanine-N7-)-methyltransferase
MCIDPETSPIEFFPPDYLFPIDLAAAFPREAPIEIDLGCGGGSFLIEMAARNPERNFLGIERLLGRVRKLCKRAARRNLDNVRVLRIESAYALRYLFPGQSIAVLHILFPDPWPKRRHNPRRVIQQPFLDAAHTALRAGGELRIKTDDAAYFAHITHLVTAHAGFRETAWTDDPNCPLSDFEAAYRRRGLRIYRTRLLKV